MVDTVVVSMANEQRTPEEQVVYEQKMADLADAEATKLSASDARNKEGNVTLVPVVGDDGKPVRPEAIPEKFWNADKGEVNVEALLKSQKDGEEAILATQAAKQKTPEELAAEKVAADKAAAEAGTPAQAGSIADASKEYAEKGELTDTTYDALAKVGLSKEMVNEYIEGQTAIRTTLTDAAHGPFEGNAENYEKAADWAASALSDDEIAALDVQLTSRNPALVKQGAIALQAKYAAQADVDPLLTIHGDGGTGVTGSYFKSSAEMKAAMSDPKSITDATIRAVADGKIERGDKAGVNIVI